MDGENHGKSYEQMDDLGGFPPIFGNTHLSTILLWIFFQSLDVSHGHRFEVTEILRHKSLEMTQRDYWPKRGNTGVSKQGTN